MMLLDGEAEALISGYSRSYPVTVKPMLEIIGKAKGINKVATTNLMITNKGPLFLSDTSINIDPSSKDLAVIAKMTAETVKMFGMEPNIAMLSYSNFGSSNHPMALKVKEAVKFLDNAMSIGPIMMGMSKAVHVLQLGASVEEMVNMSAVAVVDAQKKAKLKV